MRKKISNVECRYSYHLPLFGLIFEPDGDDDDDDDKSIFPPVESVFNVEHKLSRFFNIGGGKFGS